MTNTITLIPVIKTLIKNEEISSIDARELHKFLEVGKFFSNWIKDRISKYKFQKNTDFIVIASSGNNPKGGRPAKNYIITLDMAKELSMVERTGKGREARRYFIDCEKQLHSLANKTQPCISPLTPNHREKLSSAINVRTSQSSISRGEMLAQLRKVYEVDSWESISDKKYTEAICLVKTLVLADEELHANKTDEETPVYLMEIRELRNYARKEFGVETLGRVNTKEAREMVQAMIDERGQGLSVSPVTHNINKTAFISMKSSQLRALSYMAHNNIDEANDEIAEDYFMVIDSLSESIQHANSM